MGDNGHTSCAIHIVIDKTFLKDTNDYRLYFMLLFLVNS